MFELPGCIHIAILVFKIICTIIFKLQVTDKNTIPCYIVVYKYDITTISDTQFYNFNISVEILNT